MLCLDSILLSRCVCACGHMPTFQPMLLNVDVILLTDLTWSLIAWSLRLSAFCIRSSSTFRVSSYSREIPVYFGSTEFRYKDLGLRLSRHRSEALRVSPQRSRSNGACKLSKSNIITSVQSFLSTVSIAKIQVEDNVLWPKSLANKLKSNPRMAFKYPKKITKIKSNQTCTAGDWSQCKHKSQETEIQRHHAR